MSMKFRLYLVCSNSNSVEPAVIHRMQKSPRAGQSDLPLPAPCGEYAWNLFGGRCPRQHRAWCPLDCAPCDAESRCRALGTQPDRRPRMFALPRPTRRWCGRWSPAASHLQPGSHPKVKAPSALGIVAAKLWKSWLPSNTCAAARRRRDSMPRGSMSRSAPGTASIPPAQDAILICFGDCRMPRMKRRVSRDSCFGNANRRREGPVQRALQVFRRNRRA